MLGHFESDNFLTRTQGNFVMARAKIKEDVSLWDYATGYVERMDGSSGYLMQCKWAIGCFERFARRTVYIHELDENLLNKYLAWGRERLSPQTRLSRRNILLRLWRAAARDVSLDARPEMPNRDLIGQVKRRHKPPVAWSKEEVEKLLGLADQKRGAFKAGGYRISKRLYWRAYILAAWSTGLRRCDLVRLTVDDIPASGRFMVEQQKTGRPVFGQLNAPALAAIRELVANHGQEYVFPEWCGLPTWRKIARRFVRRAGLKMSIGKMRGASGTNVEITNPGKGSHFLGNTEAVFAKHYFDRRQAAELPQPQPLNDPSGGGNSKCQ
jgi:integrase